MRDESRGTVVFNMCLSCVTRRQAQFHYKLVICPAKSHARGKCGSGSRLNTKLARVRLPHITVPWLVSYHIKSYVQRNALSLNQLNFQPTYNYRIYIPLLKINRFTQTCLRVTQMSPGTQAGRDTDQ